MKISIITESAELPVTLAEVKAYLKVDSTADDDMLNELINTAVNMVETYLHCFIITKTVLYAADYIHVENGESVLHLPYPLGAIDFIKTYNDAGTATTVTNYKQFNNKIIFSTAPQSVRLNEGYHIQYDTGIAVDAESCPADIKIAIKQVVSIFYDCCDLSINTIMNNISRHAYLNMLFLK